MINEEVRHIIESELQDSEELLWAEVVSQKKINEHLDDVASEAKYQRRFNGPLSIFITFAVFIVSMWASLTFFAAVFFTFFVLCIFTYVHDLKASNLDGHKFPGGYALTNQRLFTFDKTLTTWTTQDASSLKSAYEETKMLRLKPVGSGFFKEARLAYLASNYSAEKHINAKLKRLDPHILRSGGRET